MNSKTTEDNVISNVDLSALRRKVWLVKVPKYLSRRLSRAQAMDQIGKIVIKEDSQILFNLSEEMTKNDGSDCDDKENLITLPIEHKFLISKVDSQTMSLFSHNRDQSGIAIEGNINRKGELSPIVSTSYLNLHKERVKRMTEPKRRVQQLDRSITVFKPISNLPSAKQKTKRSPIKKCKKDRETVRNMLFSLFEKHQYYYIKDLERLTLQPVYYLKEVMREMCVYNLKNPHQYMWELRPEFRHYSDNKKNQ